MSQAIGENFVAGDASALNQFRPNYPATLYQYLAILCSEHDTAWDVATGTGKVASQLAGIFETVYASDPSTQQLKLAPKKENIKYFLGKAETTIIPENSMDLITVGQALHWFDIEAFFAQVKRILKPGGVLAVWSYKLPNINHQADKVLSQFSQGMLKDYWPSSYQLLIDDYQSIEFPYPKMVTPSFYIEKTWTFERVIGYLNTWSAVKNYIREEGVNPIERIRQPLEFAWCDTHHSKKVKWPLNVIVCQKPE